MTMYKLEPIYPKNVRIDLPTTMYSMKNIHQDDGDTSLIDENMSPQEKALAEKQQKMLNKLEWIQNEMKQLSVTLGHKFGEELSKQICKDLPSKLKTVTSTKQTKLSPVQLSNGIHDYVISVSPDRAALSSVLIAEMLKQSGVSVAVSTHLHSSLKNGAPSNLLNVTGGLTGRLKTNVQHLILTYIWKDELFCPYMMYSSAEQTKILGDVNIARHLCRCLAPQLYNESDPVETAAVDKFIELSKKITNGKSKEKESALKTLNASLGNSNYLALNRITLADIVNVSAIMSSGMDVKTLPKNVAKWLSELANTFPQTMGSLLNNSSSCNNANYTTKLTTLSVPVGITDYVMSVSPNQPAISTILIGDILRQNDVNVSFLNHVHSSLKCEDIPKNVLNMTGGLNGRLKLDSKHVVFTYVWKGDEFCPYMGLASVNQAKLHGEANIARYLCRAMLPQLYDETNASEIAIVDKWIDRSSQIATGCLTTLKSLDEHLAVSQCLALDRLTLADVMMVSALFSCGKPVRSLPLNVRNWLTSISALFSSFQKDICRQ